MPTGSRRVNQDTVCISSHVRVVVVGVDWSAPGPDTHIVVEEVEAGQIPSERLAFWKSEKSEGRLPSLNGLYIATETSTVNLHTTGWDIPRSLDEPVPDLSRPR